MYQGEMPIEELMKMYSAAENESTDMQSDVESSQESSEEGTEEDDEQTLEEEERMEGESDHKNEIDSLQKEGMNTFCCFS